MTKPTFAVAVTFEIKPDKIESFIDRVKQQARDSVRLEPGCFQFDVLVDSSDPNIVVLYETYTDPAAFETHKATDHFADFDRAVTDLVVSKQVRCLTLLEN